MGDYEDHGDIKAVYVFSIIALFILLLACINFMNLTTAQSGKRFKEVGMRKVSGADKYKIVQQFLGESLLFSTIAFIIAVILVIAFLPTFNNLSGKEISFKIVENGNVLIGAILTVLFTGFSAGLYPALVLSGYRSVDVLKGVKKFGSKNKTFKRTLVIIQFTVSIALIAATLVVHRQLNLIQNSKLGFDREHVLWTRMRGDAHQQFDTLKNELLQNSNILGVTAANQLPTKIFHSYTGFNWEGKDPNIDVLMNLVTVDHDFIETLHIEMEQGRTFSRNLQTGQSREFILNRKAAEIVGTTHPIGEPFSIFGINGTIIGVVKDFHFETFYHEVNPLVIVRSSPASDHYAMIRVNGNNISDHIKFIKDKWNELIPNYPFESNFLDEDFNSQYGKEQRMETLFNYFTALALFIAFLGLFGLVSFESERRTKEIGIRKTLGAPILSIVTTLIKELIILTVVANIIAWPAAFIFMSNWLQNFALHVNLGFWIFFLSGCIAFFIAMISVSFQTIKAARANPVDSLRYE